MSLARKFRFKLGALFCPRRLDTEMEFEMRMHLELRTEKNIADGMSPEEAISAANSCFGRLDQLKEKARAQRGCARIEYLLRDFYHGALALRHHPGAAAITVFAVALAIGASTAVFSLVNTTVLRPFPYPHVDRLVVVHDPSPPPGPPISLSPVAYREFLRRATVFDGLAASVSLPHNITPPGSDPVRAYTQHVTANFFSVLQVRPILGRDFRPDDGFAGNGAVAILSHRLWTKEFGARPEIVGKAVHLDSRLTTIIGVMPANFQDDDIAPTLYAPLVLGNAPKADSALPTLFVIGRLKDKVTLAAANIEIGSMMAKFSRGAQSAGKVPGAVATSLVDQTVGFARPLLFTLCGAVVILLLITCINIANLLLVHAVCRQTEAVQRWGRRATRGQLARQLLGESLLLGGAGSAVGAFLAYWGVQLLPFLSPADLPRANQVSVATAGLAFSCGLVMLAGFGFGLASALESTHPRAAGVLRGRRKPLLRNILVISEIALAYILLVSTGLFTRSFVEFQKIDYGYRLKGLFWAPVILSQQNFPDGQNQTKLVDDALRRIARVPGVASASFASRYLTDLAGAAFVINGHPEKSSSESPAAFVTSITPDYLRTRMIPVLQGRTLTAGDSASTSPVILINQELVHRYFSGQNPIGQHLRISLGNDPPIWREVVGVVGSVKDVIIDFRNPRIRPQVYLPFAQCPSRVLNLEVRLASGSPVNISAIRGAVHALDKDIPLTRLWEETLSVKRGLPAVRQFSMALSLILSVIALVVAVIGIHGVMAFNLAQRTAEVGFRWARGVRRSGVLRLIFCSGGRTVAAGLVAGGAGALGVARLLCPLLSNVGKNDPLTLGGAALLFSTIAFIACWMPAFRAVKGAPHAIGQAQRPHDSICAGAGTESYWGKP